MKTLSKSPWKWTTYLTNEKGVSDIIVYAWGVGISLLLFILLYSCSQFVAQANEIQRIAGGEMRDSMRIHNGLTAGTQGYLITILERKGFDSSKLTITGTPAGAPFGSELTGSISYEYQFPVIDMLNSAFPSIVAFDPIVIHSQQHAYALGVIR